jgi:hypothetical protein
VVTEDDIESEDVDEDEPPASKRSRARKAPPKKKAAGAKKNSRYLLSRHKIRSIPKLFLSSTPVYCNGI